ncbi:hypothetical protein [Streptosporangium sp. NPDC000396]|uniref:hypothetical protein n=1 Tax=Streptosporangium sp. NPDC000396 TaxID=3366185 RepID=UPI0036ABC6D8
MRIAGVAAVFTTDSGGWQDNAAALRDGVPAAAILPLGRPLPDVPADRAATARTSPPGGT